MPDSVQKLGIEVDLALSGSFDALINKIKESFASIDLTKLEKQIQSVETATEHASKTGLDFSKLNSAQWKLLEEGASKSSISISKANTNLADLNKTLATVANNERDWATISQDTNGKYISGVKARELADKQAANAKIEAERKASAEIRKQLEINAAYNVRSKQLGNTTPQIKSTTDAAYVQYKAQNGLTDKNLVKTTEEAYRQREKQLKELDAINNQARKLYAESESIEGKHQQQLAKLEVQEEALIERKEKDLAKKEQIIAKEQNYTKLGQIYMNSYKEMGATPVNGGWAKTSAVNLSRRSSMDDMQEAAKKYDSTYQELRPKIKEYDDWLKGLHNQGLALWKDQLIPMKEYNSLIGKTNSLFDIFGTSVGGVIRHLTEFYAIRGAIFAVTGEIKSSIGAIVQYRQTVSEIAAITTATKEQTKEYEQTISQLARTSKFSAVEIASAMKTVAQQGIQSKDLVSVTRSSEQLAAAVGGDPTAAAHVITNTMNIWKMGASEAKDIASTMAAAMKNSALTVEGLSTAFNYLGAQAKASNMSLQETTSIIAVLKKQGMQDSTVGTGLSQFLKILTAPTPKVKNLWKELGIGNLDQVNPKIRTFADILQTITEKGIKKFGSEFALTDKVLAAFEMRTGRNLVAALVAGSDAFKAMHLAMQYSQAGAIALERTMEGPQVKINKLKHEFMLFVQEIVDSLSPAISIAYETMMKLTIGMQSAQARTELLVVALGALAVAIVGIGQKLMLFAAANPLLTALSVAVGTLGLAFVTTAGYTDKSTASYKEWLKSHKESSDTIQREINTMNQFIGSVKDVNGHVATYNDLNESQKKVLDGLAKSHPGLISRMKEENDVRKTGIKFMEEEVDLRFQLQLDHAKQYNAAQESARKASKTISDVDAKSSVISSIYHAPGNLEDDIVHEIVSGANRLLGKSAPNRVTIHGSEDHATRRNAEDDLNTANKQMQENEGRASAIPRRADGSFITDVKRKDLEGKDQTPPAGYTNENNGETAADKKAREKAEMKDHMLHEKVDKMLGSSVLDAQLETANSQLSLDKQRLAATKEHLSDDGDLQKYKDESIKIIKEENSLEKAKITLDTNKKAAADVSGTLHYNDDGTLHGIVPGEGFTTEDATAAVARRSAAAKPLYEAADLKAQTETDKANSTTLVEDKMHTQSSLNEEKRINRRLFFLRQDIAVKKELASTGQEVDEIEADGLDKEIALIKEKSEALNSEITSQQALLDMQKENKTLSDADIKAHQDRVSALKEEIADNDVLWKDIQRKQDTYSQGSWKDFKNGVNNAQKRGYKNNEMDRVGEQIATTGYQGLVGLLDQSLNKLEQLKWSWKDFGKTFGNIMISMAEQLQKSIIQTMLLAAWQKIAGILTNSIGSSIPAGITSGAPMAGANAPAFSAGLDFTAPNFGTGFATGGQVVGGTPGKDSVHAMLMPGEIVINKSAVDRYGSDKLLALNAQKFATGGLVGGITSSGSNSNDDGGQPFTLQIVNVAQGQPLPDPGTQAQQIVNVISADIAKRGTTYQSVKGIMQSKY